MIIECEKCKTRFRFDDALMEDAGVWLRCSRCQDVFFYKNPGPEITVQPAETGTEPDQGEPLERLVETGEGRESIEFSDTVKIFPPTARHDDADGPSGDTLLDDIEKDVTPEPSEEMPKDTSALPGEDEGDEDEDEDDDRYAVQDKKDGRFTWKLVLLIMLINFFIGGGVYLFFFPEIGEQALSGIRSIPVVQYIFGAEKQPGDVNPGLIKITDITNRYVYSHASAGTLLLVVEGKAINRSQEILTRIRIQGKVYDGTNRILQMRMSYCGNLLADDDLGSLQESEIQQRLSTPQDANVSRDRLLPNREIPFMLVFAIDKAAGIDKRSPIVAGAVPIAAERLLN